MRDGHRCVFSHGYDVESVMDGLITTPADAEICGTQLAHVLPIALSKFDEDSQVEREAVASVWFALNRYFPALDGKIGPNNLNQHANLVTLNIQVHNNFYNKHRLAFNPIDGQVGHFCNISMI